MAFNIGSVSADITADNSKFIKAFNQSGKAVDKLGDNFRDLEKRKKTLEKKMDDLRRAGKENTDQFRRLNDRLENLRDRSRTAKNRIENLSNSLDDAKRASKNFSDGLGRIGDFVAGNLIADGISRLGESVFDLGKAFIVNGISYEQTEIAFQTMLGSAKAGQKMLKELSDFAVNTPFEIPQLEDTAKSLLGMGFTAEEVLPTVEMLGDISAGIGTDKLPFLTLALSQVRTAGKLTGNELRQFSENGVPLLELLADKAGVSMAQMRGSITDGKVTFEQVQEVLKGTTEEGGKFFGLMEAQSQTIGGKWSNMVDEITVKGREIFEELKPTFHQLLDGVKPVLDGVLNSVVPLVNFLIDNKNLIIGAVLGISAAILHSMVPALIAKATAWWGVATAMWASGVIPAFLAIAGAVTLLYLAISWVWESNFLNIQGIVAGIGEVLRELWGILMENLMPVLNDFWEIMKNLWNTFVAAISPALQDLQAELQKLWDIIQPILIPILNKLKEVLVNAIKVTIDTQIKPALDILVKILQVVLPIAIEAFIVTIKVMQAVIGAVANFIQQKASSIQNIFKNMFQLIGNLIRGDFKASWKNLKEIIKSVGDLDLTEVGRQLMQGFINGIKGMSGVVMEAAKGIADSAKNAITSALDINSPSKWGRWAFRMVGAGGEEGLQDSQKGIEKKSANLARSAKAGIMQQAIATPTNNMQTINNQKSISTNNTNNFNISGAENPMDIGQLIEQKIAQSNRNNRLNSNNAYA